MVMKEISVLVYGMTDKVGGMETFFMNYYRMIDHSKVHFCFLANYPTIAFRNEIETNGDRVVSITKRSENPLRNYRELKRFFGSAKNSFDACYMMALDISNVDFLEYCKKYGIKVRIIHSHNSGMRRPSAIKQIISTYLHYRNKRRIESLATEYWACSKRAAEWIFNQNLIDERVKIIHNAIPAEKYYYNKTTRKKVRAEYGIDDNVHVYGHVGRFMQQKNPYTLINIFGEIVKNDSQAICWMIGDGPLRQEIERRIGELGLKERIILLGQKDNVSELMQAMDCFIFPSLFEGLSLVMIEAQAAGLPILCSDTLSEEHSITDLVEYYSLDNEAKDWAAKAIEIAHNRKHEETNAQISAAGYDIAFESVKLQKFIDENIT